MYLKYFKFEIRNQTKQLCKIINKNQKLYSKNIQNNMCLTQSEAKRTLPEKYRNELSYQLYEEYSRDKEVKLKYTTAEQRIGRGLNKE